MTDFDPVRRAPDAPESGEQGIEKIIAEAFEWVERNGPDSIETFVSKHPHLARRIRQAVHRLEGFGLVDSLSSVSVKDPIPERLGGFKLVRRIGGGGMGIVYLAVEETLDRFVALKLVRPEYLQFGQAHKRFRRETEAVARLKHPSIVPIYQIGEDKGIPFFTMEWVAGCSLGQVLKELGGKSPEKLSAQDLQAVLDKYTPSLSGADVDTPSPFGFTGSWSEVSARIIAEIADALHHAHGRGIVHRDVKPSNIMLTREGRVLLLDFGLAKAAGTSRLTRTGSQLGSLPYMAPEQVDGLPGDACSDIYATGVTLYEMLALRAPYLAESQEVTRRLILDGDPEDLTHRNRSVSVDVETICLKAMDREPQRRYATSIDLTQDLRNFLEHIPISARRAGRLLRARRWSQRHPVLSVFLGLGTMLLILIFTSVLRERASSIAIERLSDHYRVQNLEEKATRLWPADSKNAAHMDEWLRECRELLDRKDAHIATLDRLRESCLPYDEDARRRDQLGPLERREGLQAELRMILKYIGDDVDLKLTNEVEVNAIRTAIGEEEAELSRRTTWTFEDPIDQWKNDMLSELILDMNQLALTYKRVLSLSEDVIPILEENSVTSRTLWEEAIQSIERLPIYAGLRIEADVGIIPLFQNPQSGLWEFLLLLTGEAPVLNPDSSNPGRLALQIETGITLVLIPGGVARIGTDDPFLGIPPLRGERPAHDVALDPFFISKYEVTEAQWERMVGGRFPMDRDAPATMLPEREPWESAKQMISLYGLDHPTEAQWEYACRAGTMTAFSTGELPISLAGFANIFDQASVDERGLELLREMTFPKNVPGFSDGFDRHCPVGSFLPNPWGLHDVHGNVSEWCRDVYVHRGYKTVPARPGDGLRYVARGGEVMVSRGGDFSSLPREVRSSSRLNLLRLPFGRGIRPVRAVRRVSE